AAGQREAALEGQGAVEIAADVEEALQERLGARQRALAQAQPGLGVGPDRHVRPAPRDALADRRLLLGQADLPRLAHVAEAHVVRRVQPGLSAQIALREGGEDPLDSQQTTRMGWRPSHGRAPYPAFRTAEPKDPASCG